MHYSQNIYLSSSKKQQNNEDNTLNSCDLTNDYPLLHKDSQPISKRKFIIYDPLQKESDNASSKNRVDHQKAELEVINNDDVSSQNKIFLQPCNPSNPPSFKVTDIQMKDSNKSNNYSTAPSTAKNSDKIATSLLMYNQNFKHFPVRIDSQTQIQNPCLVTKCSLSNKSLMQDNNALIKNANSSLNFYPHQISSPQYQHLHNAEIIKKEVISNKENSKNKDIKELVNDINKDIDGDSIYSKELNLIKENKDPIILIVKQIERNEISKEYLKHMNPSDFFYFFSSLLPFIHQLMHNEYGNYFIQELLSYTSKKQRLKIWKLIKQDLESISKHNYASHCIQVLIIYAADSDDEEQKIICKYFNNLFHSLMEDSKGTHVIQKLLYNIKYSNKIFFVKIIYENFDSLVVNTKGVCLIKQLMASLVYEKPNKKEIFLTFILTNLRKYCQDKYGHYLILYMLDKWEKPDLEKLIYNIGENFIDYSCQVYSCRIIEKCTLAYRSVR